MCYFKNKPNWRKRKHIVTWAYKVSQYWRNVTVIQRNVFSTKKKGSIHSLTRRDFFEIPQLSGYRLRIRKVAILNPSLISGAKIPQRYIPCFESLCWHRHLIVPSRLKRSLFPLREVRLSSYPTITQVNYDLIPRVTKTFRTRRPLVCR